MSKKIKVLLARKFRKEPTKSEKILWDFLKNRKLDNIKFRRQHAFQGYIIDFYCPRKKIALEIDGKIHDNQKEKDQKRQEIIEEFGIKFIRVSANEIENDINNFIKKLNILLNN